MLHTLLNYSRFSSERFFYKRSSCSCSPLKSLVGVYPEVQEWIGEALAGVIVSRTLHRFVVSTVGLSSVWSLLVPIIETMSCAYLPLRISLSRSNLWSLADILTFPDCLNIFVVPLQFKLHCPMYYIPPTRLSHLHSLTTP